MATYRCSDCGINYPATMMFANCRKCGGPTSGFANDSPDEDWQERVEQAQMEALLGEQDDAQRKQLVRWEAVMLLDLQFTLEQTSALLAIPNFSWHEAKYLRERGCPPELAVLILT